MKKDSSLFSPRKESVHDDQASMMYVTPLLEERAASRELVGDSMWLSRKMVDFGCSLEQTLHVMEERCKSCNVISPMFCMEQCETWKVKKELKETNKVLSEERHQLKMLNAVKNKRRLAIIEVLSERPKSSDNLQKALRDYGYSHSQKTIEEYLKPLLKAGLIEKSNARFRLTLYGRKVHDAVVKHGFAGQLPIHSGGHEERILKRLMDGPKTRGELIEVAPAKSLSRTLKRLGKLQLIVNNSPSDRVFYFRTKRLLSLERVSSTQKRISEAIPQAGISARDLSKAVGINLRRTYKYLRNLRGKKLVFRREVPITYELTPRGREIAEFLGSIAAIQ